MALVALGRKNNIENLLKAKEISIYKLAQLMNDRRPEGQKEIHYKSVYNLVKRDTIPYRTYYGTLALLAEVLSVDIDDLETKKAAS